MTKQGDQAFRVDSSKQKWSEMTYGGAVSFLRRQYSRDLSNVDIVISGLPYDAATTNRPVQDLDLGLLEKLQLN